MSGEFAGHTPPSGRLHGRRIARIRREIALLSEMDDKLWRRSLLCAALIIPSLAALFRIAAAKLSFFGASLVVIVPLALGLAVLCWWAGRYSLLLPWILVMLAIAVILESAPEIDADGSEDRKASRARKVASALEKRRALLAKLEALP